MSLWPHKALSIVITSDLIGFQLKSEGPFFEAFDRTTISLQKIESRIPGTREAAEPLAFALESVDSRKRSWNVYLDNHLVRAALIAPSPLIKRQRERCALAKATFINLYGGAAADWDVTVDQAAPVTSAALACAADSGFLKVIDELAARRGARIQSIKPLFTYALSKFVLGRSAADRLILILSRPTSVAVSMMNGNLFNLTRFQTVTLNARLILDVARREALLHGLGEAIAWHYILMDPMQADYLDELRGEVQPQSLIHELNLNAKEGVLI